MSPQPCSEGNNELAKSALRRIGIFGVAGFNRGDDAICHSLIAGFRRERRDLAFVVPVLRHGAIADEPGVRTFQLDRRSLAGMARLAAHVWRCDAVVLGGGSVIQDQLGGSRLRGILGYSWMVSGLARLLRKPLVTAPIGVDALISSRPPRRKRPPPYCDPARAWLRCACTR
jgi:polysaccharide pyruvyl transferase WcaK-like protein